VTGWSRWLAGLVVIVLLPAALLVAGQWPQEERLIAADPDDILADRSLRATAIALGQPLFRDRCAACHGVDGRGSKSRSVPDLTDGDWLYGEARQRGRADCSAWHPLGRSARLDLADMPAYATPTPYPREPIAPLSPTDVADVAAWLRALHGSAPDAAAAERGRRSSMGVGAAGIATAAMRAGIRPLARPICWTMSGFMAMAPRRPSRNPSLMGGEARCRLSRAI
jgi:mono/diheme cytochrome c family protein